ncbi:major facilitator superfamily MFS_1 [Desulfitobacterium hafniense DCB-2]|uniref:Major facilitator super MFS 1 n=2 Tax=Desulfitobacterium hafniense TaxID=49338 RepID=A0A098B4D9_DESHA|nr:MFS transporter [Desulfitobacterium hafniense]ACL19940.1 major facilitator superfamily MFS_1 [Desulfitobacterium hafniense DCB-2]CDX03704.1 Major facilitator super MFS 1 [Desulfitobacterium hafniense]
MNEFIAIFKEKGKVLLPILLFIVFQSAFNAFSPVLKGISAEFPEVSVTLIQMVITLPSLLSLPMQLLSGVFSTYLRKKTLVQIALCFMLIGGLAPILVHSSIYAIFVSCGLIGLGQGLLISVSAALITEHFDGNQRGTVFGFKQVASSAGIMFLTLCIGYLAMSAWYNAYWVYLLVIPVLIVVTMYLPKGELDAKLLGKGVGASTVKAILNPSFFYMCFMLFFMGALLFTFYTNISMMVVEKGLGEASAVGQVTALNSFMTIGVGLIIGLVLRAAKKYLMVVAMVVLSIAFFILFSANTFAVVCYGGIAFGIGAGLQQASTLYFLSEAVPKSSSTLGIGLGMAFISFGVNFSPLMVNTLKGVIFNMPNASGSMLVAACGYIVLMIIDIIRETFFNKDSKIGYPASKAI